jgi:DNA-binding transcriptional MerR regulator
MPNEESRHRLSSKVWSTRKEEKMSGWIKLHRALINWEWYEDIPVKILFIHFLLKANHEPKKWRGQTIEVGQFITSIQHLAQETGLTLSQVRTAIKKLKSTHEIANESHTSYSVITIKNWNTYQTNDTQNDKPIANESQTNRKRIATTKEDKEREEYKEVYIGEKISPAHTKNKKFSKPSIEDIKQYCIEQSKKIDPVKFYNFYESKNWYVGKNKMSNWKAAIASWERNNNANERTEIVSGNHYESSKATQTLLATYKQDKENATAPTTSWAELGTKLRRLK